MEEKSYYQIHGEEITPEMLDELSNGKGEDEDE